MRKSLIIAVLVIFILGDIVNLSDLVVGGIGFFIIGEVSLSLMPYLAIGVMSYWFKSLWITIVTGIIILALDIWLHLYVFVFPTDAQDPILLLFSPIYFLIMAIISFAVLGTINKIIKIIKTRKLFDEKPNITVKGVLLQFVLPVGALFLYFIISVALLCCTPTP